MSCSSPNFPAFARPAMPSKLFVGPSFRLGLPRIEDHRVPSKGSTRITIRATFKGSMSEGLYDYLCYL